MDNVLKRLGLKKGEPRDSEARQKLQKQLFAYTKCVDHGFPSKPSALAYDPKLRLLAIGTKTGAIRIYGTPGVEFCGQHKGDELTVLQIFFLPGQGRVITLCSDNSLHLWETENGDATEGRPGTLTEVRSLSADANKLKTITACCLTGSGEQLLIGTEGGNIHVLNVYSFKLTDHIIYQDSVIQNVPDDFKVNPGAVESIQQHPTDPNKYLIGYNRGLIVLWDTKDNNALHTYNASQQLESIAWHSDGTQFMSAHADGSYIIWSASDSTRPKEQASMPYGPFACKAINKIQWKTAKADTFIIFSGGMPRASCGDRHTVSVMQGNQHVVFDFTSRVVDFVTMNSAEELSEIEKGKYDEPHTLLVLVEEELVAIDLQNDNWNTYRIPYLCSLHSSAITCAQHVSNVPEALWNKIIDVGETQFTNTSNRDWPVTGGKVLSTNGNSRDLLLTGHEDGSVRFWDASSTALHLIYKLNTANIFGLDISADQTHNEDEDWPPFRKVGTFDPYSDDPRLGIQKIVFCPLSESLVIGGTAGQVISMRFEREDREQEVKVTTVNIVDTSDGFAWKGHEALGVRGGEVKFAAGFQPVALMQLQPPAAVTALTMHSEWQLVAAGTAHGFAVYDYAQKKEVLSRCTLNPAELSGGSAASTPRRKSFKKSLRESFRRLRRRRSERKQKRTAEKAEEATKLEEQKAPENKPEGEGTATEGGEAGSGTGAGDTETSKQAEAAPAVTETPKPVERQVEARDKVDDGMASMVRCLYFADTFLLNGQNHTPTLWAGTNAGTIYIYQVTIPASDKRDGDPVQCVLAKEIQLQHRAPVISVGVIDRNAQPLPGPLEVENERAKAADMTGNHHVVVISEEQFKIFSLPSLKANNKFKLTAHEGAKVRKVAFVNFRSKSDERYSENDIACLTNLGEIHIFTIPQLRRQMKQESVHRDNISGIASCVFTQNGEGFFLSSPSEFTRFSISVRYATKPLCAIVIAEDARPELEPLAEDEKKEEEAPASGEAKDATEAGTEGATTEGEAAAATEQSREAAENKDGDKPAEAEKHDESGMTIANQSVISDDDIRVHLSEQSTIVSSGVVSRTVVTRTVISETTTEGGTVRSEHTTVQRSVTAGGDEIPDEIQSAATGAAAAAGGVVNSNLDDDTKLTTKQISDSPEETLEELHITEEGDEEKTKIKDSAEIALAASGQSASQSDVEIKQSENADSGTAVTEGFTKSVTTVQESATQESPVQETVTTKIIRKGEKQEVVASDDGSTVRTITTTTTTVTEGSKHDAEQTETTIATEIVETATAAGIEAAINKITEDAVRPAHETPMESQHTEDKSPVTGAELGQTDEQLVQPTVDTQLQNEHNEHQVEESRAQTQESHKPVVEESPPQVEESQPQVEESQPQAEESQPQVEESQPQAEESQPQVEESQPQVEESQPQVEESQPQAEESQPQAEESQPQAEESQPQAEESQPQAEESQPQAEESQPESHVEPVMGEILPGSEERSSEVESMEVKQHMVTQGSAEIPIAEVREAESEATVPNDTVPVGTGPDDTAPADDAPADTPETDRSPTTEVEHHQATEEQPKQSEEQTSTPDSADVSSVTHSDERQTGNEDCSQAAGASDIHHLTDTDQHEQSLEDNRQGSGPAAGAAAGESVTGSVSGQGTDGSVAP